MKCVMDTSALRRWGKIVHTLGSIGDQNIILHFEHVGLILATFNHAGTICAKSIFDPEFFVQYEQAASGETSCAVASKCFMKPFRSMRFLTKCVSGCELEYTSGTDSLQVTLQYKYGGQIRYSLTLASGTFVYQPEADFTLLPNLINSYAKVFTSLMSNFAHGKGVVDLTIKPQQDRVLLKNCMTDLVRKDGKVYTELSVSPCDFIEYDVKEDCELTIDMKEFKIFAAFAEQMKLQIALHFDTPEEPVTITGRSDDGYYTTLTLATKRLQNAPPRNITLDEGTPGSGSVSAVQSQPQQGSAPTSTPPPPADLPAIPDEGNGGDFNMDDYLFDYENMSPLRVTPTSSPSKNPNADAASSTTPTPPPSTSPPRSSSLPSSSNPPTSSSSSNINVILNHDRPIWRPGVDPADVFESPHDRVRRLFQNLGETFVPSRDIPGMDVILAPDSDEEND